MGITSDGGLQTNIYSSSTNGDNLRRGSPTNYSSSTNGDNLRRGSPNKYLFEQYKWG
jgi:hypothetical protein